jgi:hypothetical protein
VKAAIARCEKSPVAHDAHQLRIIYLEFQTIEGQLYTVQQQILAAQQMRYGLVLADRECL